MDSWLDHCCLVPLLQASISLVALFGVVTTVGLARPPPEPPPSNTVEYVIDLPLYATTIIEHLFHGIAFTATDLGLAIGAGSYHGRAHSTADRVLSLGYGLYYFGVVCSAADLSLSLEYGS